MVGENMITKEEYERRIRESAISNTISFLEGALESAVAHRTPIPIEVYLDKMVGPGHHLTEQEIEGINRILKGKGWKLVVKTMQNSSEIRYYLE